MELNRRPFCNFNQCLAQHSFLPDELIMEQDNGGLDQWMVVGCCANFSQFVVVFSLKNLTIEKKRKEKDEACD